MDDAASVATRRNDAGIRMLIAGAVIAVLAPLAGFLGGSMVGSSVDAELDPLFLWLFAGLVVGGIGAVVALLGGMRWAGANRRGL